MKLYATTTSERASKGQGGNEELVIEILAEKVKGIPTRTNLFHIRLCIVDDELYATLHDYSNGTDQNLITHKAELPKGKQQTGKVCYCDDSGLSAPHIDTDH